MPNTAIVYPRNTIENKIGMDAVRKILAEECVSEPARELVAGMKVSSIFKNVELALRQTHEMLNVLADERAFSISGLIDTRAWFHQLRAQASFIEVDQLNNLRRALNVVLSVKEFFEDEDNPYPVLGQLASLMFDVGNIVRCIDSVMTAEGKIKDNASPTLSEIRTRMGTIQNRVNSAIRKVLARAILDGIVDSDTSPSVRDGRLVIPVAAMNKRRLSGIVHDESASGKTYFIEPAEVVELNNEQRELEIEERHEIVRILIDIASQIRPNLPQLTETFKTLYYIDFIRAKALFALKTGASMPRLHDKCIIRWHDARHPVLRLNLEAKDRKVVPLDIELTDNTARILVVSGPNAGGKSVTLKTVGINQYMLQCGMLPVMDPNSDAGIFESIFVDLGDDQSIEDDLSTYSSHLRNMKFILSHGNSHSLVLIDEFGAGTEPQIGGAIAQALLKEFNNKQMWGVITTHFQNLKQFAQETLGIVNGSMVYDRNLMKPTFRLAMGSPGSSFAVEIALRTGLPKYILDSAEEIVGSDYFNLYKYLLDFNRDRRYWENKRNDIKRREKHLEDVIARYEQNAENLRQKQRSIIDEAKSQADGIIAQSNAAIEQTIREIRQAQAGKEETKAIRKRLAEQRSAIAEQQFNENQELKKAPRPKKTAARQIKKDTSSSTVTVGDNVLLDNQGQPGQVLEINRDKATVSFGLMKLTVPVARLSKTMRKPANPKHSSASVSSSSIFDSSRQRQLSFKTEIDVRGMRADEAVQAVTYFIDDALQFSIPRVRILHGTGTGALRLAIRQYLKTVAAISSFHDEDVRMGGAGITVVNL